jgi:hypothetical protein
MEKESERYELSLISQDEFETFARKKPEYAKIFTTYHELKILHNNVELERIISDANKQSEQSRNNECDVSVKKKIDLIYK